MAETKNLTLVDIIIPRVENKTLVLLKDTALVLSFALITGVCAKLKIEIGVVPITMQTLAVLLSGALLGSKKGALSQISYLLMGLAGFPWFARGGGMSYLLSPTFGYIIGFVLAAFVIGWLCERGFAREIKRATLAMLIGNILLYIPGLLWLARFVGFNKILTVGFYPFVLGDLLKLVLAGLLVSFWWKIIQGRSAS
jgi:biotin transporter BioY